MDWLNAFSQTAARGSVEVALSDSKVKASSRAILFSEKTLIARPMPFPYYLRASTPGFELGQVSSLSTLSAITYKNSYLFLFYFFFQK